MEVKVPIEELRSVSYLWPLPCMVDNVLVCIVGLLETYQHYAPTTAFNYNFIFFSTKVLLLGLATIVVMSF